MKTLKALILLSFFFAEVTLTAYTASIDECGKSDGITASGTIATEGRTIAADHLPFGTIVEIFGRRYVVEDRFGGDHTDRIDIFMESVEKAIEFGRRQAIVRIRER